MKTYIFALLVGLFYATTASALAPMDAAYNEAVVLTQWADIDPPGLPQALSSSDPNDFTESVYGCHTYLYRTAANSYNLFFTTQKPVVITQIENQQKTREVTKYGYVKKTRKVEKTRLVQKTRKVKKFRTVTKTREVWKTKQIPEVYPVHKTRQIRKTRTVYAPWWWWSFGMGWYSWEEPYWVTETYTTFEIKYVDQRYRAVETYPEQQPYTDTEIYTITEPYWGTETYIEKQAYTVEEAYTEPVEVKKVITKECKQLTEVASLINTLKKDNSYRFVFDNEIGMVAKVSKVTAERTQGLLSYRILELTPIETISPPKATTRLPIDSGFGDKKQWHWYRLFSIHIKKLALHRPVLSLSQGFNSLNLAWNNAKYIDNYVVEVAYNGNHWQTLDTVNNEHYVFPYSNQWDLDKTQIRIKACRDNGNTCSQSNSQSLSTVVKRPIATDKYLLALANTPMKVNLAQSHNTKVMFSSFPKHGQAVITADSLLTYTPTTGYLGVDEFSHKISNQIFSQIHSNPATITIEVVDYKEAAIADRINGNTQATNAIKKIISTSHAKDWAELESIKKQATIMAKKELIEVKQALATAKQKAITVLTATDSDAAIFDKIRGNTRATDTVKKLIKSASTIAELESKKTQAIDRLRAWDAPVAYEYDELSRLIKVVIPHQQLEINYTYDAMGNRLTRYSQWLDE